MSREGKELKKTYSWEALSQRIGEKLTGDLEVKIKLYFKDKRVRDIDNYNKILLDALTGIIWQDDKQIQKMTIEKFIDKENPRIEIISLALGVLTS